MCKKGHFLPLQLEAKLQINPTWAVGKKGHEHVVKMTDEEVVKMVKKCGEDKGEKHCPAKTRKIY